MQYDDGPAIERGRRSRPITLFYGVSLSWDLSSWFASIEVQISAMIRLWLQRFAIEAKGRPVT